uniref:Ovule protein n=1 Tax=Steinernema glaseri TaxID=37863 RepID=A0A1I7Y9Y2_9BILA
MVDPILKYSITILPSTGQKKIKKGNKVEGMRGSDTVASSTHTLHYVLSSGGRRHQENYGMFLCGFSR